MTDNSQGSGNKPPNRFIIQHWIRRGVEFQNDGKFHNALPCFVRALELNPNRIDIWYKVGTCWKDLRCFGDAIASYNACYQRSQTQQNLWLQAASQFCLGHCYNSLQQQDHAVSAYSVAYQLFNQIGNNPHTQQAWDYLNGVGNSFLNNKQFQEAALFYQKLLKVVKPTQDRPKLGWVWHGLGRGFSGDGLDELAVECHRKMLEISRELSDWQMEGTALYWLAWESWKLGQLADAIAYYESAIAVYEKREEGKGWVGVILNYLVDLYQKTGEFEKAIAVLERRLAILRDSQDKSGEYGILYQIGGVYYNKLKDCDRAFDYYHSALEVARGLTERQPVSEANACYMLGLMCEFLDRLEEAVTYYREALQLYTELGNQNWVEYKIRAAIQKLEKLLAIRSLASLSESDPQRQFLLNVLQTIADSKGDAKVVEPLLKQNLDKLDENFADILRTWAAANLKKVSTETATLIAQSFFEFGVFLITKSPLDQRADNQEIAIACHEATLEVYTRTTSLKQWALTQKLLAIAYNNRIGGERAENIEKAIACCKATLEVYTRTTSPKQWVGTQNELASAYRKRIWGERAENIEKAIACYEAALEVHTRTASPEKWAMTQNNLGFAYYSRIRGERAENIEKAITCYEVALEVYTRTAYPEQWVLTQNRLAIAYNDRIGGERAENIEKAIACYEAALKVYTRTAYPEQWAMTQNNLAYAYYDRIWGKRAENIEKAIACYNAALLVYSRDDFLEQWARIQNNLANAYYMLGVMFQFLGRLEEGLANYREGLRLYAALGNQKLVDYSQQNINSLEELLARRLSFSRSESDPNLDFLLNVLGATANTNGDAKVVYSLLAKNLDKLDENLIPKLHKLAKSTLNQDNVEDAVYMAKFYFYSFAYLLRNFSLGDRKTNLEIVINCYQICLTVFDRDAFSQYWAATQNNLGEAYLNQSDENCAENIERAMVAFQAALEVFTRDQFSLEWATLQNFLGIAYHRRISGDKGENLDKAIQYYKAALEIRTRESCPEEWAETQRKLGIAYDTHLQGNIIENREKAIVAYEAAITVFSPDNNPEKWAKTQNLLGLIYHQRTIGDMANNLEKAIAAHQLALTVYTRNKFPEEWADTQNNIGYAYTRRIRGDLADNKEKAIASCEAALTIYTKDKFPEQWAKVQFSLAYSYFQRFLGNRRDNLEIAISIYESALTILTDRNYPDYWAAIKGCLCEVYKHRVFGHKEENLKKALQAGEAALKIAKNQGNQVNSLGNIYLNLGDICINLYHCENKQDYVDKARVYYENSLSIFPRESYPERWAMTQRCLTNVYQRIGGDQKFNLAKVVQCYQNALQIFTQKDFPEIHAETLRSLGIAYLNIQDIQAAYNTFSQAIDTVDNLRYDIISGDQVKRKLNEQWLHLYQLMVEVCIQLKRYDKALEYADRSKTRNLVELLATRDLYPKGDIPPEILDELTRLRQEIETEQRRLEIEERRRDSFGGGMMGERIPQITDIKTTPPDRSHLNQLQQQLEDLIKDKITLIDPDFRLTQKVEPIPFAEIQALTGENTAILEWYILRDRFLVFIVTPPAKLTETDGEAVTLWQSSTEDYQQLIKWANDYLNAYRNRESAEWKNSLTSRLQQLGEILHIDELIAAIEKTAKKCDRLVLIPNRFLHLFPLHALPLSQTGEDITYLMDRFPGGVSYAPSCQLLQTANNRQCPDFSQLLAIQNPTQDLEYTDLEVSSIRNYFNPADILEKEKAKKSAFDSQQKTAHCNHFSCHGYFNFENPLLSALLLSDCYLEPPPTTLDRSQHLPLNNNKTVDLSQCLTLGDVFALDLRSCRLVTLSACETGLIDILSNSDEYIGLPSGFLVAGSTNVISSLWAVSDISTALLMIRFYQLLREGEGVAIALNHAQNWLRNATKSELLDWIDAKNKMRLRLGLQRIPDEAKPFDSPYYWAAFCAVGKFQ